MISLHMKRGSRVLKAAEAAIPGDVWTHIAIIQPVRTADIPAHADFVLCVGKAAPTIDTEKWASVRGAFLCCLPEADDFLAARTRRALNTGEDLTILDATLRKLVC